MRYLGEHARARALTEETTTRFEADYESEHPDALACQINLAADLAATGDFERALAVSTTSLERYETRLGAGHPYTCVARNNHASYLLRVGRNAEARELLQQTYDSLQANPNLGDSSPFTHGAGINLANAYAANGQHELALELDRKLQRTLTERNGPNHPVTLTCALNLSLDLTAAGRHDQARTLREQALPRLADVLGDEHPTVIAARAGGRLDRELVPQPI
jgi:tetratricopeptide (TPR) repeat protein